MCIKCGKTYSGISSGRRHIRENHRFQAKAQCQFCKRFYKNERQRNEHYNTAHGISARQLKNVIKVPFDPDHPPINPVLPEMPLKMEFTPELDFVDLQQQPEIQNE